MRVGLDSCGLPEAGDPAINVPGRKKVLYLNRAGVLRPKNLWRGGLFRLPWLLFIVFVVPRNERPGSPFVRMADRTAPAGNPQFVRRKSVHPLSLLAICATWRP
jgi:hypothetical protein